MIVSTVVSVVTLPFRAVAKLLRRDGNTGA